MTSENVDTCHCQISHWQAQRLLYTSSNKGLSLLRAEPGKHFSMRIQLDCLRFLWFARTITILDFTDTSVGQEETRGNEKTTGRRTGRRPAIFGS